MIRLITWTDENMTQSASLCAESGRENGVDFASFRIKKFDDEDTFRTFNSHILKQDRGSGYWLFKPYCIYDEILTCAVGDILIYCDAGCEFIESVHKLINCMDQDIMLFTNNFPHVEWCKADVFTGITGIKIPTDGQDEHLRDYKQVQASLIIFKVNETTRNFVKEWLLWCQMPGFIDDSPSKLPNYRTFAEHRHDQAILCCMQIKYGYKLHWFPSTMNMHRIDTRLPEDNYPAIINHHRRRNFGMGNGDAEWPQS
jgi:hypothetical protein